MAIDGDHGRISRVTALVASRLDNARGLRPTLSAADITALITIG
jgi:hypothetical protein